jgi:hypothetical protein
LLYGIPDADEVVGRYRDVEETKKRRSSGSAMHSSVLDF